MDKDAEQIKLIKKQINKINKNNKIRELKSKNIDYIIELDPNNFFLDNSIYVYKDIKNKAKRTQIRKKMLNDMVKGEGTEEAEPFKRFSEIGNYLSKNTNSQKEYRNNYNTLNSFKDEFGGYVNNLIIKTVLKNSSNNDPIFSSEVHHKKNVLNYKKIIDNIEKDLIPGDKIIFLDVPKGWFFGSAVNMIDIYTSSIIFQEQNHIVLGQIVSRPMLEYVINNGQNIKDINSLEKETSDIELL